MTEHLSIPRAEFEALLAKLEDGRRDYAERVGRAQGYLDKWLMTANSCKKCGEAHPHQGHWPDRLCTACYYAERDAKLAGDNPHCDVHGTKKATRKICPSCGWEAPIDKSCPICCITIAGDTCHLSAAEHAAAADAALADAIKQRLVRT